MHSPIKRSRNKIAKIIFMVLVAGLWAYVDIYCPVLPYCFPPSPLQALMMTITMAIAIILAFLASGLIIYGITRIFRKPKEQKSLFKHGLFYGFWVAMLFVVMQVFMLVELLIMRS